MILIGSINIGKNINKEFEELGNLSINIQEWKLIEDAFV